MSQPASLDISALEFYLELGVRMARRGDRSQAELLLRRALRIAQRVYGPTHGEVARVLLQLSRHLRSLGKIDEAKELELQIAQIKNVCLMDESASMKPVYGYTTDKMHVKTSTAHYD